MDDGKQTDPDLKSSQRSGNSEAIQNAKRAIRKNSGFDNNKLRDSKAGSMVGTELDQIVEDVSQEQSRILNSGDLDTGNNSNSRANSRAPSQAPSNNAGGALAGIFEQSAAAQQTKKRQF